MPTLEEVKKQIERLTQDSTILVKKEINFLPEILSDDENVLALTTGMWKRSACDAGACLIVCTSKRVILLDKGFFSGLNQKEISLQKISSIEQKGGIIAGDITIVTASDSIKIDTVPIGSVKPFVEIVNRAMDAVADVKNAQLQNNKDGDDVVTKLERLAELKEKGHLTESEFKKQKKALFDNKS